jgi:hypothetical protein
MKPMLKNIPGIFSSFVLLCVHGGQAPDAEKPGLQAFSRRKAGWHVPEKFGKRVME